MSRIKNLARGLASGYAAMVANALYTMGSVPLALSYLSKEEFGLWSVVSTIGGYLMLIDLGMSSSLSRMLIDHKDNRANGAYGGMIKTGMLVLAIQSGIILLAGLMVSWFLPGWLKVPAGLTDHFVWLMCGQTLLTTASFMTRIFGQILYAHQRLDLQNYAQVGLFVCSFLVLWVGFALGMGVFSLLEAGLVGWLGSTLFAALACQRLGLWPRSKEWGLVTWEKFRELFVYGADVFLISLGTQLITASQTVVISRALGMDAAAVWTVMTKAYTLVCQMVWRVIGFSMPAFAEMQVRGEEARLQYRYHTLFIFVNVLAGVCGVMFAVCNGPFTTVWTGGACQWPTVNNWLLAAWLMLMTQVCSHNSLIMCVKQIKGLKYVYFIEGCVFVVAALWTLSRNGIPGMLVCSLACTLVFTLSYGTWRVARLIGVGPRQMLLEWQLPLIKLLAILLPIAVGLHYLLRGQPPLLRLLVNFVVVGVVSGWAVLRICLPKEMVDELIERLPPRLARAVQVVASSQGKQ